MNSLLAFFAFLACALAQYRPQPDYAGKVIAIVRQASDVNPDGSYQWSYETENGIGAQEQGVVKSSANSPEPAVAAQGSFHWTAPDGTPVDIQYIADENGYQPQGSAIPTPPPIPPEILLSLKYNEEHPEPEEPQYKPQRKF